MIRAPMQRAIDAATDAACRSPCRKSRRGVAIWVPSTGEILATAYNRRLDALCDGTDACRAVCRRVCIHAEEAAILNALDTLSRLGPRTGLLGAHMLHIKVVDGLAVASGPPSCLQCSRLILEAGIASMWLFHQDGWREYNAREFHNRTLQQCGIRYT